MARVSDWDRAVSRAISERAPNRAAGGGDFLTSGPTMLLVGDNPGGIERVTVQPLSGKGITSIAPDSGLIRLAGGGSVTADGGLITRTAAAPAMQAVTRQEVLDMIANLPAPVVTVTDINTGQNRVRVTDNLSND